MGSVAFGSLIAELLVMSHLITVCLAYALSIALPSIGEASYYSRLIIYHLLVISCLSLPAMI